MIEYKKSFIDQCVSDEVDIDDYIDDWHYSKDYISLFEFLGFKTDLEYCLWAEKPYVLVFIVYARKNNTVIDDIISNTENFLKIAKLLNQEQYASKLIEWLDIRNK